MNNLAQKTGRSKMVKEVEEEICRARTHSVVQITFWKRQILLSRINIYIVTIIVTGHTIRIVPNVWEIVQSSNGVKQEV